MLTLNEQPRLGEQTEQQARFLAPPTLFGQPLQAGIISTDGLGFADPFPGTYPNYRRMSSNPTLALAKAVKTGPLLASAWGWQAKDKETPDEIVAFIRDMLDPMRPFVLNDMLFALDMGNQSFELVWERETGTKPKLPATRYVIRKIKPLLQELTTVLVDPKTGQFKGLQNGQTTLNPGECFHFPYDMRAGNWYGRSLHENVRREFCDYDADAKEMAKLAKKLSGIVAIARVLRGMAKDKDGKDVDRFTVAKTVVAGLAQSKGVVFESLAHDADDLRNNPDLAKLTDITIETLDFGSTSPALSSMLDKRKQYQSEFMQGWLLPPRAALEGQHGTLAEAEVHADVGITGAEILHQYAVTFFNWYVVDPLLVLNFGEQARGSIYATPAPILDSKKIVLKQILTAILQNAATLEMALAQIDTDAIYDQLDIPKRETIVPVESVAVLPQAPPPPLAAAAAIDRTFAKANAPAAR
jgi:hypothetical protein